MAQIISANVKVMLSYDYSHFEINLGVGDNEGRELSLSDVDSLRKDCQRLADKAVKQYQIAKEMAAKRQNGQFLMDNFESQCKLIERKNPEDRTIKEIAMLKRYHDEQWRLKFQYEYDYEDDFQYNDEND